MKTEPTEEMREIIERLFDFTDSDKAQIDMFQKIKREIAITAFKEGQSSPKIKQLEWKEYENYRCRKSYFAKTPFSPYEVADGGDHFTMFSPDKRLRFASADAAKAAAQRDFEKRIKECLE